MPTYEYECKTCGHTFDAFQSMSDAVLKICPKCGKELRRIINGGSGVIFKGSGFYVTDKGGKTASGAAGSAASGGAKPKPAGDKPAATESGAPSNAGSAPVAKSETAVSSTAEKAAG
jgi:putative FmdB family regulatory protein